MNYFKALNSYEQRRHIHFLLEVYDPISKEFYEEVFENVNLGIVKFYKNKNIDGSIVYTFDFKQNISKKSIKIINEILGNKLLAYVYTDSEDKFLKEFSRICFKYLDFSLVEF